MPEQRPEQGDALASTTVTVLKNSKSREITPELVQKVTDKVYALMLQELKINSERSRIVPRKR